MPLPVLSALTLPNADAPLLPVLGTQDLLAALPRLHALVQVRILVHTDVTKYLEFKGVDGSYVLNKGRVEKVPATDYEALRSPLLGLFEKRRLRSFLLCVPPQPSSIMHSTAFSPLSVTCAAGQQADGHTVPRASDL